MALTRDEKSAKGQLAFKGSELGPQHKTWFFYRARLCHHCSYPACLAAGPLSGFSTLAWADVTALDDAVRAGRAYEFPGWSPAQGTCLRCAEMSAIAGKYADTLPQ